MGREARANAKARATAGAGELTPAGRTIRMRDDDYRYFREVCGTTAAAQERFERARAEYQQASEALTRAQGAQDATTIEMARRYKFTPDNVRIGMNDKAKSITLINPVASAAAADEKVAATT